MCVCVGYAGGGDRVGEGDRDGEWSREGALLFFFFLGGGGCYKGTMLVFIGEGSGGFMLSVITNRR